MWYIESVSTFPGITSHRIFDSETHSVATLTEDQLIEFIQQGNQVYRTKVVNNKIKILTDNIYKVCMAESRYRMIVIGKIANRYKVRWKSDKIDIIKEEDLVKYIKDGEVSNAAIIDNRLQFADEIDDLSTDKLIEEGINSKIRNFKAKLWLLGLGADIETSIECGKVKLIRYKTESRQAIIPGFIDCICSKALLSSNIEKITLEEGIRRIGSRAFEDNNLTEVIFPSTVEYIGGDCLTLNKRLFNGESIDKNQVKLLSTSTFMEFNHRI